MHSWEYIARRLLLAAGSVFVIVSFNFVLFRALPGSAISNIAHVPNSSPALRHALEQQFGLDQSKWEQYKLYLSELAHGNLGISYADQQPVADHLKTALANTIPMVALGTLVAIVLGTLLGVLSAWKRRSWVGHTGAGLGIVLYSLPAQWIGLLLILLFGSTLPTIGMHDPFLIDPSPLQRLGDTLEHMILPAATLALVLFGQYTLVVRSAVLETLGEDYVLTARAKGLKVRSVLGKHVLRNAALPITTLTALSLGYVVAGSILVETVFAWPGIGLSIYQAVNGRDYPMLQGAFLVLTVSIVFFNLLADLLYAKLDPRIAE